MGFIQAVGTSYGNILNFSGRASRAEYWWFVLFQFLVLLAFMAAGMALALYAAGLIQTGKPLPGMMRDMQLWTSVMQIAMFLLLTVPALASLIRRLHDTDRSGWWFFICLLPLIGALVLLWFVVQPGTPGRNRFGPPGGAGRRRRGKNAPKVLAPDIVAKRAARDAKRRAEIHEYYARNVAGHASQG